MNRFTPFCEPDCHNTACSASLLSGVAKATSDKIYYTPHFYIANRKLRYYFDFVNRILLINFNFAKRTFKKHFIPFNIRRHHGRFHFTSSPLILFQMFLLSNVSTPVLPVPAWVKLLTCLYFVKYNPYWIRFFYYLHLKMMLTYEWSPSHVL